MSRCFVAESKYDEICYTDNLGPHKEVACRRTFMEGAKMLRLYAHESGSDIRDAWVCSACLQRREVIQRLSDIWEDGSDD